MNKIDDILERLQGQMPQVPEPDRLTYSIMEAISKTGHKVVAIPLWIRVVRYASSAAAIILIALFIGLNNQKKTEPDGENMQIIMKSIKTEQPVYLDIKATIKRNYYRAEKRKSRQLRETQIKNLYANY